MLFVIVGSSGSGKNTLAEQVFSKEKEIVSFTTRKKRELEKDGIDYFFLSEEEFLELSKNNSIVEKTFYADNWYGVSKTEIEQKLRTFDHCYSIVDYSGYKNLLRKYPEKVVSIFVTCSKEELRKRLINRKESEQMILERLELVEQEQESGLYLDHVIENKDLEQAISEMCKIIEKY